MSTHGGARRDVGARSEPGVPEIDVSRFELLEQIGTGGMGTVYRALQRSVGRYVAVKVLAPEQAANVLGLTRFVREANAIARIAHPNIVQLIDFGRDHHGRMLLVMELLEGESLRDLLRRVGTLPPERAVHVAVQCLAALRSAHAAGIVHRDLKPENLFVQRVGADDVVKVLDFGVAKIGQGDEATSEFNTTQGTMVGTLRYMAPEQIAGEAPDHRVDLYAVGVLLYEMLCGTTPFDTRDRFVLLRQILTESPTPLSVRAPLVSPALSDVVMAAMSKVPTERFQSADALRDALLPYLSPHHARLTELSENRGVLPTRPQGPSSAEHRSGVVRTGAGPDATSAQRPQSLGLLPSTPVSAPPPRRRALLAIGAVLSLSVLALGLLAMVRARPEEPVPASAAPAAAQPMPPAPSPATPPAPAPAVAARMVLVETTPPGAALLSEEGETLCAATPCAVPVPAGGRRSVRVQFAATRLDAVLDSAQAHAHVDLSPLLTPRAPPAAPRPTAPRPPRRERQGDDIPMLLPGATR